MEWKCHRGSCTYTHIFDIILLNILYFQKQVISVCFSRFVRNTIPPYKINHVMILDMVPFINVYKNCLISDFETFSSLRWRHNERDSVSNHQPYECLLNRLFTRRSKNISKLHVTGLCAGNSPETGEFPAQRASNVENFPIWWRHHVVLYGMLYVTESKPHTHYAIATQRFLFILSNIINFINARG